MALLSMALMTASVKSRHPSQIWTYPTFPSKPRFRLQPVLQTLKAPMSYLRTTPPSTLKVTKILLLMKIKSNLLWMRPVHLRGSRRMKRKTETPRLTSSRFILPLYYYYYYYYFPFFECKDLLGRQCSCYLYHCLLLIRPCM